MIPPLLTRFVYFLWHNSATDAPAEDRAKRKRAEDACGTATPVRRRLGKTKDLLKVTGKKQHMFLQRGWTYMDLPYRITSSKTKKTSMEVDGMSAWKTIFRIPRGVSGLSTSMIVAGRVFLQRGLTHREHTITLSKTMKPLHQSKDGGGLQDVLEVDAVGLLVGFVGRCRTLHQE